MSYDLVLGKEKYHITFIQLHLERQGNNRITSLNRFTGELERVGVSRLITAISMQSEIFCSILNKEAEETEMHRVGSE